MNRIVKHHVPAGELPEQLREGFAAGEIVEVEVRSLEAPPPASPSPAERISLRDLLRRLEADQDGAPRPPSDEVERRRAFLQEIWESAGPRETTTEEAVRRIRQLRDEGEA